MREPCPCWITPTRAELYYQRDGTKSLSRIIGQGCQNSGFALSLEPGIRYNVYHQIVVFPIYRTKYGSFRDSVPVPAPTMSGDKR
jgi:hypothetical protein